jgi:hypothetical protein
MPPRCVAPREGARCLSQQAYGRGYRKFTCACWRRVNTPGWRVGVPKLCVNTPGWRVWSGICREPIASRWRLRRPSYPGTACWTKSSHRARLCGFRGSEAEGGDTAGETAATVIHRAAVAAQGLGNWEPEEVVATAVCSARDADEGRVAMTSDDFREKCIEMINRILAQGFERPIYFAAIAIDGLTTIGSSETVTGAAQPLVKTDAPSGSLATYLLPINVLFVDPKGKVAHGVIDAAGAVSCRVLN